MNGTAARRWRWRWRTAFTPSRMDGSALVYNQRDTYMPDLLICREEHAAPVFEALAALG